MHGRVCAQAGRGFLYIIALQFRYALVTKHFYCSFKTLRQVLNTYSHQCIGLSDAVFHTLRRPDRRNTLEVCDSTH